MFIDMKLFPSLTVWNNLSIFINYPICSGVSIGVVEIVIRLQHYGICRNYLKRRNRNCCRNSRILTASIGVRVLGNLVPFTIYEEEGKKGVNIFKIFDLQLRIHLLFIKY